MKHDIKLAIDDELSDKIIKQSLREQIVLLKKNISDLRKKRKLEPYQQVDLDNDVMYLNALEKVYDYYGGNLK